MRQVLAIKSHTPTRCLAILSRRKKGSQVSTGSIVRNAGSHRILFALLHEERTSKDLKNIVGAINSVNRFDGEYMARLVDGGLVERSGDKWTLTIAGLERIAELGSPVGFNVQKVQEEMSVYNRPVYEPPKKPPVYRPGSMDYRNHPSRIADTLVYPDGRKEKVKDGY